MLKKEYLSGREFIKRILDGELNFASIQLEENCPLDSYKEYPSLLAYLAVQDFQKEPLILIASDLRGLRAKNIYIPFVQANEADFSFADLQSANLSHGCIDESNFYAADLREAKLRGIKGWKSDFLRALVRGIDFTGAFLERANLSEIMLEDAMLEKTVLRSASLKKTGLRRTFVQGADFLEANLREATLEEMKGLDKAHNLELAEYWKTKVGEEERQTLEEALKKKELFTSIKDATPFS